MTSLITILIALLGYGSPSDYEGYTEEQLNVEIAEAEAAQETTTTDNDGGGWDTWDEAGYIPEPQP